MQIILAKKTHGTRARGHGRHAGTWARKARGHVGMQGTRARGHVGTQGTMTRKARRARHLADSTTRHCEVLQVVLRDTTRYCE